MNKKLVQSLAEIIQSLTTEEQELLEATIKNKKEYQKYASSAITTPLERSKAFIEWVESHREINFPHLSDEDISRENIYGERG